MKKLLTLICALPGLAGANQAALTDMEYVDAARCFIAADSTVMSVMPLLADAWINAADAGARQRAQEAFSVALARGCDIDAADVSGLSALNLAIARGDGEVALYLLTHGADPRRKMSTQDARFDGLDSFALLDVLQELDAQTDRAAVRAALEARKAEGR